MRAHASVNLQGVTPLHRTGNKIDAEHQVYVTNYHNDSPVTVVQYVTAHDCRRMAAEWARVAIECDHADLGVAAPVELAELVEGPVK